MTQSQTSCPPQLQLDRFAFGELTGRAREAMAAHLSTCARCAAAIGPGAQSQPLGAAADKAAFLEQVVRRYEEQAVAEELSRGARGGRGWFSFWLLTPIAAAALLVGLVLWWPHSPSGPLPSYQLELTGGARQTMGAESETEKAQVAGSAIPTFTAGSRLELVLRPDRALAPGGEEVVARLFSEGPEGLVPVNVPVEVDARGSVRLSGILGRELTLPSGESVLWVAISGRKSMNEILGAPAQERLAAAQARGQAFRLRVRVEPAP